MAQKFTSKTLAPAQPIVYDLDGIEYTFTPPKKTTGLLALLVNDPNSSTKDLDRMSKIVNWFSGKLAEGEADAIEKRLNDEDDPLTVETILEAAMDALGQSTNRPTS